MKALKLSDEFRLSMTHEVMASWGSDSAIELRRLAEVNAALMTALDLVMACAGDIASAPDGLLQMALEDGDEETRRQANAFLVARAARAKAKEQK